MGNLIENASGLDGTVGFAAVGGGALSADEATLGAPGRIALVATGTATATVGLQAAAVAASAGAEYDVAGLWSFVGAEGALAVQWLDGGGTVVDTDLLPVVRIATGAALKGLRRRFHRGAARLACPVGASQARLRLTGAATGAYTAALLKPMITPARTDGDPPRWDPGPTSNPDLDLPIWPADLPPVLMEGYGAAPTPLRKAFESDAGIPMMQKVGATARQIVKAQLRLSPEQLVVLEDFHAAGAEPFWFVRPDTDELCQAWWTADGAPALDRLAADDAAYYAVGLQLAVA